MKFYGQRGFDQFLYDRYFKDYPVGTFMECGALDGREISTCLFFEETLGWTGYNIEPVPSAYELLVANRPNSTNINLALSDRVGTTAFTQAVHPKYGQLFGNGSIQHVESHLESIVSEGCALETFTVQTTTFSELMCGKPALDLMVLDVEGHELSVIRGMHGAAFPKVLAVEVDHVGLDSVMQALVPMGYQFDSQHHDNAVFLCR